MYDKLYKEFKRFVLSERENEANIEGFRALYDEIKAAPGKLFSEKNNKFNYAGLAAQAGKLKFLEIIVEKDPELLWQRRVSESIELKTPLEFAIDKSKIEIVNFILTKVLIEEPPSEPHLNFGTDRTGKTVIDIDRLTKDETKEEVVNNTSLAYYHSYATKLYETIKIARIVDAIEAKMTELGEKIENPRRKPRLNCIFELEICIPAAAGANLLLAHLGYWRWYSGAIAIIGSIALAHYSYSALNTAISQSYTPKQFEDNLHKSCIAGAGMCFMLGLIKFAKDAEGARAL